MTGITLRHDIGKLFKLPWPRYFLPTFLHEFTHHWCYQSPVGTTLAMVMFKALRDAVGVDWSQLDPLEVDAPNSFIPSARQRELDDVQWDVLDALVSVDSTLTRLRPLSEGLATFAEFDVVPGDSTAISSPMLYAWMLFAGDDREKIDDADTSLLSERLFDSRLHPWGVFRKANLLVEPFDPSRTGYLSGYMTVKNLWRSIQNRQRRAIDPDLWFNYLRSYVYADLALVDLILDPAYSDLGRIDAIGKYFTGRFNRLTNADIEHDIAAYERWASGNLEEVTTQLPVGLGNDIEQVERGKKRFDELMRDFDVYADASSEEGRWRRMQGWWLVQRGYACVADERARIKVTDAGQALAWPQADRYKFPVVAIRALEDVSPGTAEGHLCVLLVPTAAKWVMAVIRGRECVALTSPSELDDTVTGVSRVVSMLHATHEDLQKASDAWWDDFVGSILRRDKTNVLEVASKFTAENTRGFYEHFASLGVPEKKAGAFIDGARDNGFWTLMGRDRSLVEAYALLSTCWSPKKLARRFVAKILAEHGHDLDRVLERLDALERQHGIRLYAPMEDAIATIV